MQCVVCVCVRFCCPPLLKSNGGTKCSFSTLYIYFQCLLFAFNIHRPGARKHWNEILASPDRRIQQCRWLRRRWIECCELRAAAGHRNSQFISHRNTNKIVLDTRPMDVGLDEKNMLCRRNHVITLAQSLLCSPPPPPNRNRKMRVRNDKMPNLHRNVIMMMKMNAVRLFAMGKRVQKVITRII